MHALETAYVPAKNPHLIPPDWLNFQPGTSSTKNYFALVLDSHINLYSSKENYKNVLFLETRTTAHVFKPIVTAVDVTSITIVNVLDPCYYSYPLPINAPHYLQSICANDSYIVSFHCTYLGFTVVQRVSSIVKYFLSSKPPLVTHDGSCYSSKK